MVNGRGLSRRRASRIVPPAPVGTTNQVEHGTKSTHPTALHTLSFVSRHHHGSVWPIYDLIWNDILVYVLPTHRTTLCLKFVLVSIAICYCSLLFGMFPLALLLQVSWIYYYRRVLVEVIYHNYDWANPSWTGCQRMDMHTELQCWTSEPDARRAAGDATLRVAHNPNALSLDGTWKFVLLSSVLEALRVVEEHDTASDNANYQTMPVPANWTLHPNQLNDRPIYTNIQYPWPCQPPLVPQYNPTAIYQLELENLPSNWTVLDSYSLILNGVESFCYVYVNETFVGGSKDSRLPAEFDVTHALRFGESHKNTVYVLVSRWCDGSYVEDQDDWWMAGLHRSVRIVRRPKYATITDYSVQADASGQIGVFVQLQPSHHIPRVVTARLYSDKHWSVDLDRCEEGECVWEETVTTKMVQGGTISLVGTLHHPRLWTAETPHLYTLTIQLHNGDFETVHQVESCRVGFRTIDIVKGQVTINGRPVVVAGINLHDHDPDTGKVVSLELAKKDICIMKRNNFNLVRTSHYPKDSSFYRLCDFYGLYVWDEANIEVHGMKPMGRLAHDPGWYHAFTSRVARLVQRDRNHPSVIFWSLGNEAGRGRNFRSARKMVRDLDPSRPICYEGGGALLQGTGRTELTDIICTMYPHVELTRNLAIRSDDDRPVILCEYQHAMGNSNGNLSYYWDMIWDDNLPRLQGACIWDFVDQGLRLPDPRDPKRFFFGYGGDFGDEINDAQFCINGMFTPDREAHPAVSEIKYLQQPIWMRLTGAKKTDQFVAVPVSGESKGIASMEILNRYHTLDLSHLSFSWEVTSSRSVQPIRSDRFEVLGKARKESIELDLKGVLSRVQQLERSAPRRGNRFWLNIQAFLKEQTTWADASHVIVNQQFSIRFAFPESASTRLVSHGSKEEKDGTMEYADDAELIRIFRFTGSRLSQFATIDKLSGCLLTYSPRGQNLLHTPLSPNFVRAATDNDQGGMELVLDLMFPRIFRRLFEFIRHHTYEDCSFHSRWVHVGLDGARPPRILCGSSNITSCEVNQTINVSAHCRILCPRRELELFGVNLNYKFFADGRVSVSNQVVPRKTLWFVGSIPRIGMSLQLEKDFFDIRYCGKGPVENYPDRKEGSQMGVYETTPSKMAYSDYIYPSENGSRSDCEYVSFRSITGEGVCIVASADKKRATFSCSAQLHTTSELSAAKHTCDLDPRQNGESPIHVNVDHKLMGVAGDDSWTPCVYPEFRVPPDKTHEYNLSLLPLTPESECSVVAGNDCFDE